MEISNFKHVISWSDGVKNEWYKLTLLVPEFIYDGTPFDSITFQFTFDKEKVDYYYEFNNSLPF